MITKAIRWPRPGETILLLKITTWNQWESVSVIYFYVPNLWKLLVQFKSK